MPDPTRLLFPIDVPAGGTRILRIARRPRSAATAGPGAAGRLDFSLQVSGAAHALRISGGAAWAAPQLELTTDRSDTWSHFIDRFSDEVAVAVEWRAPDLTEEGPLRFTWRVEGRIGEKSRMGGMEALPERPFLGIAPARELERTLPRPSALL